MLNTRRGSLKVDDFYERTTTYRPSWTNALKRASRRPLLWSIMHVCALEGRDSTYTEAAKCKYWGLWSNRVVEVVSLQPCLKSDWKLLVEVERKVKNEMRRRRVELCNNEVRKQAGESLLNKRLRIMEEIAFESSLFYHTVAVGWICRKKLFERHN